MESERTESSSEKKIVRMPKMKQNQTLQRIKFRIVDDDYGRLVFFVVVVVIHIIPSIHFIPFVLCFAIDEDWMTQCNKYFSECYNKCKHTHRTL